jgi:hypothetical protein
VKAVETHPHQVPQDLSDRIALAATRLLRGLADLFFAERYGHRAVVLETVAAVPGVGVRRPRTRRACVAWSTTTAGSAR